MLEAKPYLLNNTIQNYAWGRKGDEAYIPKLLGEEIESGKPYAELWIGAHEKAPSVITVDENNKNLFELSESGELYASNKKQPFPFLLKVLSAAQSLSIQTHPNKKQAELFHQQDPKNYADDNHKPEIAIALDELVALAGFRSREEIVSVCENYDFFKAVLPDATNDLIASSDGFSSKFQLFIKELFQKALNESEFFLKELNSMKEALSLKSNPTEKDLLFLELKEVYAHADAGLLMIYLLNHITLKQGQAMFIDAGVPHAYLKGNIVECMANSDNVVRAGLTPKFQDVPRLLDILDYKFGLPDVIKPRDSVFYEYAVPVKDFQIHALKLAATESWEYLSQDKLSILLVIEGKISLDHEGCKVLTKGQSVLLPCHLKSLKLSNEKSEACLIYMVSYR